MNATSDSSEIRLVLFDMAGTTVNDGGEVPAAFTAALATHGIKVSEAQIRAVRGASKRQAIRELIGDVPDRDQRTEVIYATFRDDLSRRFAAGVREIEGAHKTFQWLRQRGVHVALNTGFDHSIVDLLLAALGWQSGAIDAMVCGDDVATGRPAPYMIFHAMEATGVINVRHVANVGDTAVDLEAGQNGGCGWNIGVLSGAHGRTEFEPHKPTHIIDSVADLPRLFG